MQNMFWGPSHLGFDVVLEETYCSKSTPLVVWPDPPAPENQFGKLSTTISSLHYHNDLELGVCYQGSGAFIVDNQTIEFHSPCAEIIYPGQVHAAQSNPDDPSFWYFIHADSKLCNQNSLLHSTASVFDQISQEHADIMMLISMMVRRIQDTKDQDYSCAISLLQAILLKHRQISGDEQQLSSHMVFTDIAPAITYISSHFQEPCPVQQLADLCCMSVPTLRRKFIQAVGYSPNDYLHQIRIRNATSMLTNSNLSILDISNSVGYTSISSFNRQFLKITNESPLAFRKRTHNF